MSASFLKPVDVGHAGLNEAVHDQQLRNAFLEGGRASNQFSKRIRSEIGISRLMD
jgi:hypothetical protein